MKKMRYTIPVYLGIASVWFGTHAGPGAATGKQTAVYFNEFGKWGFITPLLSMGMLALCIYYAVEFSRIHGITNFKDFTNKFFHPYEKIFSTFFEITYLVTVVLALGASLAAGAKVMNQYWNIPIIPGTALIIAIMVLLSIYGAALVRASSTVMTAFIVGTLIAILLVGLTAPEQQFAQNWQATSFSDVSLKTPLIMAFAYAGFLAAGNIANAVSVSEGIKSRKESAKAAIYGFIMNSFLILSVVFLLFAYPQFVSETIPNYHVLELLNANVLLFCYVLMVVLAVISTGVSYSFSTVARYAPLLPLKEGQLRNIVTLGILLTATFLVSLFGLDAIVSVGYKYLGYACVPAVIIPTILIGHKRINDSK